MKCKDAPTPPACPTGTLAALAEVSPRTARRWRARGAMPAATAKAVALQRDGLLDPFRPRWSGWRLLDDALVSPEGWHISVGELRALPLKLQLLDELQRERRRPAQGELF